MNKKHKQAISDSLSKALEAPKKRTPSPALNDILSEYAAPAETRPDAPAPPEQAAPQLSTPVAAPVATPVKPIANESIERERTGYLDATHTASEARIYSVMYRETVSKGLRERHFGPKELCEKTGIRSDRTIRTALHGLIEKLSIEVVSNINGSPLGPRYRVFEPKDIIRRRKAVGMEIDPQSKRIIRNSTPAITPVTTPVDTGGKNYPGAPAETTPVTPVKVTGVSYKYRNEDSEVSVLTTSSSSESLSDSDDNARFLDSIREVYERATGNTWTTADAMTAQKGNDIPAALWGIAICHCVDRAPGHRFDRLAYVAAQAREHAETMKDYSSADLRAILRHSLSVIERARAAGKWTLSEIESEEGK